MVDMDFDLQYKQCKHQIQTLVLCKHLKTLPVTTGRHYSNMSNLIYYHSKQKTNSILWWIVTHLKSRQLKQNIKREKTLQIKTERSEVT